MKHIKILLLLFIVVPLMGFTNLEATDSYKYSNYYEENILVDTMICCYGKIKGGSPYENHISYYKTFPFSCNSVGGQSYDVSYCDEQVCCAYGDASGYTNVGYHSRSGCSTIYANSKCDSTNNTVGGVCCTCGKNKTWSSTRELCESGAGCSASALTNCDPSVIPSGDGGSLGGNGANDPVEEIGPFCVETREIWLIGGYIVWAVKVLVPALLIVFVSIDFAKASFSEDADPKKHISLLLKRVGAALIIFFIPTILGIIINYMGEINDVQQDWTNCAKCLLTPKSC